MLGVPLGVAVFFTIHNDVGHGYRLYSVCFLGRFFKSMMEAPPMIYPDIAGFIFVCGRFFLID